MTQPTKETPEKLAERWKKEFGYVPGWIAYNETPTRYVLMRENFTGSQLSTDMIFSEDEARLRAEFAQKEEDILFEAKPASNPGLKWKYYVARLEPLE